MTNLTLDTLVVRNPNLLVTEMEGDLVMLDMIKGTYFGIGGIGHRIWNLLEQPASVLSLCRTVCAEYQVELAQCQNDLLEFIAAMLAEKAVTIVLQDA